MPFPIGKGLPLAAASRRKRQNEEHRNESTRIAQGVVPKQQSGQGVIPEHWSKAVSRHLEYSSLGSKEVERVSYSWFVLVPLALVVLVIGIPTWLLLRNRRNGEASSS